MDKYPSSKLATKEGPRWKKCKPCITASVGPPYLLSAIFKTPGFKNSLEKPGEREGGGGEQTTNDAE